MLTATVRIWLDKNQSVQRNNVTPAEAAYYVAEFHTAYGKNPVEVLSESEVARTNMQEIQRLNSRFPSKKIKALYATPMSSLPETFEEAVALGMGTALPGQKLIEVNLSE